MPDIMYANKSKRKRKGLKKMAAKMKKRGMSKKNMRKMLKK